MKIFCIGRNYRDHAEELKNPVPSSPLVFLKPPTALVLKNGPFPYPNFSNDVHHEIKIVLRICKTCKNITETEAESAWDAVALGLDFTARDVQATLKQQGQPWEISKGFDGSAPLSDWHPRSALQDETAIAFSLTKNGNVVQQGNTRDLLFPFPVIIAYLSRYFTLSPGDCLFTGTPAGVGPVLRGDVLQCILGNDILLNCNVV